MLFKIESKTNNISDKSWENLLLRDLKNKKKGKEWHPDMEELAKIVKKEYWSGT